MLSQPSPLPVSSQASPGATLPIGVRTAPFAGHAFPLVVRPTDPTRRPLLEEVVRSDPQRVRSWLTEHGAVLFRGFDVYGPTGFEEAARAFAPSLGGEYPGTSRRERIAANVFTAREVPGHLPVPQHLESSFVAQPPRWVFLHALAPSRGPGGETPLADFRAVWRDLQPTVRERFRERGVRNVLRYAAPDAKWRVSARPIERWDEVFGTIDRALVAQTARAAGLEPCWSDDGSLTLTNTQPAFRRHPETGEMVWSNHVQVFHPNAVAAELARVARRARSLRSARHALVAALLATARRRLGLEAGVSTDVTFGDGAPITDAEVSAVRDAIWKNLVVFRWKRDDVLFLDNAAISHGRLPFRGPRTIAIAWG